MAAPDTATAPRATHRLDYRPPAFLVDSADLHFDLDPAATVVRSTLVLRRNPKAEDRHAPLRLDGEGLTLLGIKVDGAPFPETHYKLGEDGSLTVPNPSDILVLETEVRIAPDKNTAFSGLYTSGGNFYTQCEAEGFRRIAFFPDRPDVMTRFAVTLTADKARYPVLLSNGNPAGAGEGENGRHWAKWEDPHPKPSYLFALVAGDLVAVSDYFTTKSGRDVVLNIWVRKGDEDRCAYAMDSLKRSMKWDEEVYGFEYDLDVFNIAAVSDFNMGAMENKGLNVFNTKYVLAKPETATDGDYQGVETVIAHEYFHNWTGNRVTCRDWFQLSLKEGLTVFRDQQFSGDQGSRAVKRIRDVRGLRAAQFPEDAGPMAHPVRPDSYIEIDNFYTATVYQKGAEVVRLLHTRIGPEAFRRGMDLYVERHDNSAATIEDFRGAMQDASGVDLSAFAGWYEQAGTPELTAEGEYDAAARRYTLTLRQSTPPTPGQPDKRPLPIPVAMGLLDAATGREQPTRLQGENEARTGTRTLMLEGAEARFVFEDVPAPPAPSLLRGFSAPVKLRGVPREQLRVLAAHDTDPFTRWDSGQQYAAAVMLDMVAAHRRGEPLGFDPALADAVRANLAGADADPAFVAEALPLPGENFLADQMDVADPEAIHLVRRHLRRRIGEECGDALRAAHGRLADSGPYSPDGASIGRRALRNACLAYLAAAGEDGTRLAQAQFDGAANMTDSLAALSLLAESEDRGPAALAAFYERWRGDELVVDKWFAIQAMSAQAGTAARVRALQRHPDFSLRNPNRVRSLLGAFASGNPFRFHDRSGEGYALLADAVVALDPINASTAARLVGPLGLWRRQAPPLAELMRRELERVLSVPSLSKGTYEKASKGLA